MDDVDNEGAGEFNSAQRKALSKLGVVQMC